MFVETAREISSFNGRTAGSYFMTFQLDETEFLLCVHWHGASQMYLIDAQK